MPVQPYSRLHPTIQKTEREREQALTALPKHLNRKAAKAQTRYEKGLNAMPLSPNGNAFLPEN